ncbi:vascular endothelial growth factor receptor 1-like isoform X1 [Styela clava]
MKIFKEIRRFIPRILLFFAIINGGAGFKEKVINEGKTFKVSCRSPSHTLDGKLIINGPVWRFPSNVFNTSRRNMTGPMKIKTDNGFEWRNDISISESEIDDSGLYQCQYPSDDAGIVEEPLATDDVSWLNYFVSEDMIIKKLYVFVYDGKNLLTNTPGYIKVLNGSNMALPCRMTTKAADEVHLMRIPSSIDLPSRITYDPAVGYVVYNTTYLDAGMWKCVARHNAVETSRSMMIGIERRNPPLHTFKNVKMYVIPNKRVTINSTVLIQCEVECEIGARVNFLWTYPSKGKVELRPTYGKMGEGRFFNQYDRSQPNIGYSFWWSQIEIKKAELRDSGIYYCSVQSKTKNKTETVEVQVMDAQYLFIVSQPEFIPNVPSNQSKNVIEAIRGYSTKVSYEVAAFPSPAFQWLHNDTTILAKDNEIEISQSADDTTFKISLKVNNTSYETAGKYKLILENEFAKENVTFYMSVVDPSKPTIENFFKKSIELKTGQSAKLICRAKGSPKPLIRWYHGSTEIQNVTGIYSLLRVTSDDAGNYTCTATNDLGESYRSIQVRVKDPSIGFATGFGIGISLLVLLLICLTVKLFTKIKKFKEIKKRMELSQKYLVPILDPNEMTMQEQAERLSYDSKKWEIPRDRLKFGKTIGRGAFGRVVQATAFDVDKTSSCKTVAVKMLKTGSRTGEYTALMSELKILIHIGPHLNIVNLFGACTTKDGPLMIVVEYCRFGNLSNYLRRMRDYYTKHSQKKISKHLDADVDLLDRKRSLTDEGDVTDMASVSEESAFVDCGSEARSGLKWDQASNRNSTTSTISASDTILSRDDDELLIRTKTGLSSSDSVGSGRSSIKKNNRDDDVENPTEKKSLNLSDLLSYSVQVARGMEFLSSKLCIHRDLAARNVLLTDYQVVKICDFGLARDVYKHPDYVRSGEARLPWKWMALESIFDEIYSTKSDVWSFGVLLWEIFSLGSSPYPGIQMDGDFCNKLKDGVRMKKPEYSPDQVYSTMLSCWINNPEERPTFTSLAEELSDLLQSESENDYLDMLKIFERNGDLMLKRGVSRLDELPETFEEMKMSKAQENQHPLVAAVEYTDVDSQALSAMKFGTEIEDKLKRKIIGSKSEQKCADKFDITRRKETVGPHEHEIIISDVSNSKTNKDTSETNYQHCSIDMYPGTSACESPPSYSTVAEIKE